ncbi:hypothetical protein [Rothia halotolerans]|uniref:hypothetical protein n=1 Tax=Rothia halotolerans TaxID=405770 RepID=UPI00101C118B|nr:hypothetical protein [Rothia halotolerans]
MGIKELIFGDRRDPRHVLEELFGGTAEEDSAPESAKTWARERLAAAGVNPAAETVRAVRLLRVEEPRLSLLPAAYLVKQIA